MKTPQEVYKKESYHRDTLDVLLKKIQIYEDYKKIGKEYDEMLDNPVLNAERAELAAADIEDTRKDLDRLEEMLRSGQMNQKDFEQKYQSMLRRLTSLGQKLGPFPPKKTQPLLGSKNTYR